MNEEINTGIEQIVVATARGQSSAATGCFNYRSLMLRNYADQISVCGGPSERRYCHKPATREVSGISQLGGGDVDPITWDAKKSYWDN